MSVDAWLLPSRTSQPNTRTMIRYSRRMGANHDHALICWPSETAAQRPAPSFEAVQALVSTVQSAQHRAVG